LLISLISPKPSTRKNNPPPEIKNRCNNTPKNLDRLKNLLDPKRSSLLFRGNGHSRLNITTPLFTLMPLPGGQCFKVLGLFYSARSYLSGQGQQLKLCHCLCLP